MNILELQVRAIRKFPVIKEVENGLESINGWVHGYYFHNTKEGEDYILLNVFNHIPVKIAPETVCRCSGFALRDDFMRDMHVLFEGDIVEYHRGKVVGYGVVRYGEFYKGGLGYESDGFIEGIGWYIEHTAPTVKCFDMDYIGSNPYLLYDERELNQSYVYTGYDVFHNPEYLTKEVVVDEQDARNNR